MEKKSFFPKFVFRFLCFSFLLFVCGAYASDNKSYISYDSFGRMSEASLPDGNVLKFVYDQKSNFPIKLIINQTPFLLTYDTNKLIKKIEGDSLKLFFSYDFQKRLNRIQLKYNGKQIVLSYAYDTNGYPAEVKVNNNKILYNYDFIGRIKYISTSNILVSFQYNDNEFKVVREINIGKTPYVKSIFQYNSNGFLKSLTHYGANNQILRKYEYVFDSSGLLKKIVIDQEKSIALTYDSNANLKGFNLAGRGVIEIGADFAGRPTILKTSGKKLKIHYDQWGKVATIDQIYRPSLNHNDSLLSLILKLVPTNPFPIYLSSDDSYTVLFYKGVLVTKDTRQNYFLFLENPFGARNLIYSSKGSLVSVDELGFSALPPVVREIALDFSKGYPYFKSYLLQLCYWFSNWNNFSKLPQSSHAIKGLMNKTDFFGAAALPPANLLPFFYINRKDTDENLSSQVLSLFRPSLGFNPEPFLSIDYFSGIRYGAPLTSYLNKVLEPLVDSSFLIDVPYRLNDSLKKLKGLADINRVIFPVSIQDAQFFQKAPLQGKNLDKKPKFFFSFGRRRPLSAQSELRDDRDVISAQTVRMPGIVKAIFTGDPLLDPFRRINEVIPVENSTITKEATISGSVLAMGLKDDYLIVSTDASRKSNEFTISEICELFALSLNPSFDYPVFSLDPADPSNPAGPWLKAVYRPKILEGSELGNVMFKADWLLKQYAFGVTIENNRLIPRKSKVSGYKSVADLMLETRDTNDGLWARMWIELNDDIVELSHENNLFFISDPQLIIRAKRQVPDPTSPTGLRDVDSPNPYANAFAKFFTDNYASFAKEERVFGRLKEFFKFLVLVKGMVNSGKVPPIDWIKANLHENRKYVTKAPTLKWEKEKISEQQSGNYRRITKHVVRLIGGVNLAFRIKYSDQSTNFQRELLRNLESFNIVRSKLNSKRIILKRVIIHDKPINFYFIPINVGKVTPEEKYINIGAIKFIVKKDAEKIIGYAQNDLHLSFTYDLNKQKVTFSHGESQKIVGYRLNGKSIWELLDQQIKLIYENHTLKSIFIHNKKVADIEKNDEWILLKNVYGYAEKIYFLDKTNTIKKELFNSSIKLPDLSKGEILIQTTPDSSRGKYKFSMNEFRFSVEDKGQLVILNSPYGEFRYEFSKSDNSLKIKVHAMEFFKKNLESSLHTLNKKVRFYSIKFNSRGNPVVVKLFGKRIVFSYNLFSGNNLNKIVYPDGTRICIEYHDSKKGIQTLNLLPSSKLSLFHFF